MKDLSSCPTVYYNSHKLAYKYKYFSMAGTMKGIGEKRQEVVNAIFRCLYSVQGINERVFNRGVTLSAFYMLKITCMILSKDVLGSEDTGSLEPRGFCSSLSVIN